MYTLDLENKHENAFEENNTHQGTLERILEELNSLKYMKEEIRELQEVTKEKRLSHGKVEIFCDSFFKHVDSQIRHTRRAMGKSNGALTVF